MSMPLQAFGVAAVLSLATTVTASPLQARSLSISLSAPATRPTNAHNVPADFVGFGFNFAQLNQYDNLFSHNLVRSVADRMSEPPVIRVGGSNGDTITVDPNQTDNTTCSGKGCPEGQKAKFTVGLPYFRGFESYQFARMSIQVPFQPDSMPNALLYTTHAYKSLGVNRLAAIAIGNEPHIPNVSKYVKQALQLQSAVIDALNLTGDGLRIFEVPDLVDHYSTAAIPWTLPDALEHGLNKNGHIKVAAEHYYQVDHREPKRYGGKGGTNFQIQIMSHTSIVNHMAPYLSSLEYLNGTLPYILSETGSALVGDIEFANSFGDCLWAVDFQLYAMSKGIARINSAQRPGLAHQLWMPYDGGSENPIGVRANYYAQPFIADFIGKSSDTWVADLDLASSYFTAYAAYSGGQLTRIALVNLNEWNASSGARPSVQVTLPLPSGISTVKVQALQAAAGASALGYDLGGTGHGISWAGETWSYHEDDGNGHMVGTVSTNLTAIGVSVVVSVPNSEAVIVSM